LDVSILDAKENAVDAVALPEQQFPDFKPELVRLGGGRATLGVLFQRSVSILSSSRENHRSPAVVACCSRNQRRTEATSASALSVSRT
jgi:hypothetical protein